VFAVTMIMVNKDYHK